MKITTSLLVAGILALSAMAPVHGDDAVAIHFADLGGIKDWRSGRDGELLIEGRNGNWYRATFFGPCYELKFVDTIAFVTDSSGDLDRFSSVLVDGHRCWFRSFEPTIKPEPGD